MNLKELFNKVNFLEQRATDAFKQELADLKASIDGALSTALATVEELKVKLSSMETVNAGLEGQVFTLTGNLSEANKLQLDCAQLLRTHLSTLPGHEDYKDGGKKAAATLTELIAAEQNATNTALAATGVKLEILPTAGTAPAGADARKVITRAEFEALSHPERDAFFANGGKLK